MRQRLLFWLAACLAGCVLHACTEAEKPVTFVIVSDLHAQDVPDGKARMQAVARAAAEAKADFVVQLGDFVRPDSTGNALRRAWEQCPCSIYHVLGNHDMDRYTKEEYMHALDMPARYYSFDRGGFHFVVLDGNNLYDGKEYRPYAKSNFYGKAGTGSYIDPEQMTWLKADLEATDKRCVVFSHQSIDTFLDNGEAVRRVLEAENRRCGFAKVVLAFSGHNHSNYRKDIDGIAYIQVNSASYVWIGRPSLSEQRYPDSINARYPLLGRSIPYDRPLYAVVTLRTDGATLRGVRGAFVPPLPEAVGLGDSIGPYPLVPFIADDEIRFPARRRGQ